MQSLKQIASAFCGLTRPPALAALVIALAVAGLADRAPASPKEVAPLQWSLFPDNPVIGTGRSPKGLARTHARGPAIWNDPSVLRDGDGYSMWASLGRGGPRGVAIYKLHSRDGESWVVDNGGRPVLEPGSRKDFDSMGVETPSVIKVGNEYHMYYSAYPHGKVPLVTIGHAVSPDGVHWKKLGELTSLTARVGHRAGNRWGWLGRGEPAAIYHDGRFWLYFTDVKCRADNCKGSPAVERGISLAVSRDGQTFTQRGNAPIVLQSGSYPASKGWEGYSTPAIVETRNGFDLFCDVFRAEGKGSLQTALVRLHSSDGLHFTQVKANVIAAGQQAWAAMSVRSPSIVVTGGVWRMWFAGDNFDPVRKKPRGGSLKTGIGLATAHP